jgi:hypothetical protein
MIFLSVKSGLKAALLTSLLATIAWPQTAQGLRDLMYIGTLDHKLLIIDVAKEAVIGEIPLGGIARSTVLSTDQTKLHLITTQMQVETVDLAARQVISSFPLSDARSNARMPRGGPRNFSGIAVDPGGRYLYTTIKLAIKELDQFRIEPAQFVTIDLQDKKIAKSLPFPKEYDQGFGFGATFKVSPDGRLLYVFDQDILVYDLSDLRQVDRIELSKPPYPGASPYRLAASDDPNDDPRVVTSVFTSVDPIVHNETLGLGKLDLVTRKADYTPIGPAFPMVGFALTPDRKFGYSMMTTNASANRRTEWWVWDIDNHKVIRKEELPARPNFRFTISGDGNKLIVYGSGSVIEFYDTKTLKPTKALYLNKDTTTNLMTLSGR